MCSNRIQQQQKISEFKIVLYLQNATHSLSVNLMQLAPYAPRWTIFQRVTVPSLQVTNTQTVHFICTDTYDRISVTYFQFQIPILVCFYTTVDEVKWILIIDMKLSSKNNFQNIQLMRPN